MWLGSHLKPFVSSFIWTEPRSVPSRGWGHGLPLPSTGQSDLHRKPPWLLLRRDTWLLSEWVWLPNLNAWGVRAFSLWDINASPWFLQTISVSFLSPFPLSPELHFLPLSQFKTPPPLLHSPFIAPVVQYEPCITLIQKPGKDTARKTKCRPISPMNTDAETQSNTCYAEYKPAFKRPWPPKPSLLYLRDPEKVQQTTSTNAINHINDLKTPIICSSQ